MTLRSHSDDEKCNLPYADFPGNPVAQGIFGSNGMMLGSIYLIPQRIMMCSEFRGAKSFERYKRKENMYSIRAQVENI